MSAPALLPKDARPEGLVELGREIFFRYQKRAILLCQTSPLVVIEKSRRIGLTWALAGHAVMEAAKSRGKNVFYIGYNLEMAREFIEACGGWCEALSAAVIAEDEELFDGPGESQIKAFRINFASGFKIVALPSKPRSLRGMQGMVILDEAAFHDKLEEMLKAAIALLMWGGNVVVVSTHDGVDNPFNRLLDEIKAGRRKGEHLTITFDDAMADGLYERICERNGQTPTPDGKRQFAADIRATYGDAAGEELDCVPQAGRGSLIKPEFLSACEHKDAGKPELYAGGLVYIGRDVARRVDGQIIWGFELVGDVMWLRDRYEETGQTFAHQDAYFDDLFKRRRVAAAWIDQTGMGEKVVEDAQTRHGSLRVQGVLLTGPNRLDLAISLAERFERGLIRIPPDPVIRSDLRAIKRASSGEHVRIVNEGEVHADRFWAGALASRAAEMGNQFDIGGFGSSGETGAPHGYGSSLPGSPLDLNGY